MGQNTRGIYPDQNGLWQIDRSKWGTRFRQRGFKSYDEAERWLIQALGELRETVVPGKRTIYTFDQAAAHYVSLHAEKASIETEIYMLQGVMPHIGKLDLHQVHDATLLPFKNERLMEGRAHKTVNLALGVVRRILKPGGHKLAGWRWQHLAGAGTQDHHAAFGRSSAGADAHHMGPAAHPIAQVTRPPGTHVIVHFEQRCARRCGL